jgi:transposase
MKYIMHRLEIENIDIMKVAIQKEIARSEDSRYDHRLHGLLLVCQGLSCHEVSNILGDSTRIIEYWVKYFNEKGFEGLREEKRSGRPSVIERTTLNNIDSDLRQNPASFGYTQNLWDGKMLSHHLKEKYGIKLGVRQCQRLFNKFDSRLRKPHPVTAKSDDKLKAELEFSK